jgi:hypothetical protein
MIDGPPVVLSTVDVEEAVRTWHTAIQDYRTSGSGYRGRWRSI